MLSFINIIDLEMYNLTMTNAKSCKQKLSKVESTLDRDNFMTAEEAKGLGIIDKIVDTRKNIDTTEKNK